MYPAQFHRMERTEWNIVTRWKLAGFGVGVGLFFLLVLASEPGFVFIVDHANLLFHEAGHPIFGLFSQFSKNQIHAPANESVCPLRQKLTASTTGNTSCPIVPP